MGRRQIIRVYDSHARGHSRESSPYRMHLEAPPRRLYRRAYDTLNIASSRYAGCATGCPDYRVSWKS